MIDWKPGDVALVTVPDPIPLKFHTPGDWAQAMLRLSGSFVKLKAYDRSRDFFRTMGDGITHVCYESGAWAVPLEWLSKPTLPEPVEHPDLRALCEWCETWKTRALTAEGRIDGAEGRRDEDRKQWERERDSFANRVMQAERKRDEAEARFGTWASEDWANAEAVRERDALKRVVESKRAEVEAERAGRKDAEASLRCWKASFNVAHVNNDKLEAENEALIAAAEGRTTPKCFMCTPLLEHAERLRGGFRRGREAGQRFRAGAGLALHRLGGAVWRILRSDLLFRVTVLAALVGLSVRLVTVEVRPEPRVLFDQVWPRQRSDDAVAPVVSR